MSGGPPMEFAKIHDREQSTESFRATDYLLLRFIAIAVIFACLGLGEAVYRLLFRDFDGATDRLPIEMLFGVAFAWLATKLIRKIYRYRMETSERMRLIRERNYRIRHAIGAIAPAPNVGNQQAIRVIREEVERIEWTLAEILPR
jgi:hypothetical protein